jgi:hypothetical protein
VLYSLGNFGASPTLSTPQTAGGLSIDLTWDAEVGVTGLGWRGVATVRGDQGPEVRLIDDLVVDPTWAEESARLDAHMGSGWRVMP